ncbi:hypothetical protein ACFE04_016212 [Oxalis oulophora]
MEGHLPSLSIYPTRMSPANVASLLPFQGRGILWTGSNINLTWAKDHNMGAALRPQPCTLGPDSHSGQRQPPPLLLPPLSHSSCSSQASQSATASTQGNGSTRDPSTRHGSGPGQSFSDRARPVATSNGGGTGRRSGGRRSGGSGVRGRVS